ncbi:MAG: putative lipoprotein [Acidimicrobiaceae bacterium]|nr:putative lipoprotein [Acidimicrobiaceae bacterium]
MISDEELAELLAEAAASIALPDGGPEAIRQAAARTEAVASGGSQQGSVPERRTSSPGRNWWWAGGGVLGALAASLVAVVVLATQPSSPPIVNGASSGVAASGARAAEPLAGNVHSGVASKSPSAAPGASAPSGRDIVVTGTLVLRVGGSHLAGELARIESLASSLGGRVASAAVREQGTGRGGTVVVQVPEARFSALTKAAGRLGTVSSLSMSDADVTGQVVDLGARLTAEKDALSRLEALLARAGTVSSLLSVENEITVVQSQIEQLQGQQRVLSGEVRDASLSIKLVVPAAPRHRGGSSGFGRAWHDAVSGFLAALRGLVAASGPILFALLAAAALVLAVRFPGRAAWRAVRRRRA